MEASSTTLNITTPEPTAKIEWTPANTVFKGHSHGPNFGRYVEGCPACAIKFPDGPVKRIMRPRRKTLQSKSEASEKVIADLLAEVNRLNALPPKVVVVPGPAPEPVAMPQTPLTASTSTEELVKIMLRREAKTIEKEEATLARIQASREDMLRVGREQEMQKQFREDHCSHTKENGRTAICNQQIHNDGYVHPFCQRCFKTFSKYRPQHDQMPTSVGA